MSNLRHNVVDDAEAQFETLVFQVSNICSESGDDCLSICVSDCYCEDCIAAPDIHDKYKHVALCEPDEKVADEVCAHCAMLFVYQC